MTKKAVQQIDKQKVTVYLSKKNVKRLKAHAFEHGKKISHVIDELCEKLPTKIVFKRIGEPKIKYEVEVVEKRKTAKKGQ